MPASGNSAPGRACTPIRASCAGRLRPPRPDRRPSRPARACPPLGGAGGRHPERDRGPAWNPEKQSLVASFDGEDIDASLLLLPEVGFPEAGDPRFRATGAAVERELADGPFIHRYAGEDDFGRPRNAFLVCTFWYIDALAAVGRREEARERFEEVLKCRNRLGLLAEHVGPRSRALFGNFPQTYSHVGLVNNAMRLSREWDAIV